MRLTVSLAIVLALAVGGLVAYEYQRVPIKSHVVVTCSDPKHVGNSIVRNETLPTTVRRKDYSGPLEQHSWSEVCEKCRQREAREAREREETEKVFENLEVKFGMISWAEGPGPRAIQEVTLPPGHDIMPTVNVKNRGPESISGLRFALKDDDNCLTCVMPDWHAFGLNQQDVLAKEASNRRFLKVLSKVYDDLFGRGVPICVGDVSVRGAYSTTINPYGTYSNDVGVFSGDVLLDEPFTPVTGVGAWSPEWSVSLRTNHLIVRRDLAGGQDRHFSGYLIYKGVRRHIGTVTVHVMYSQRREEAPPKPAVLTPDCIGPLQIARANIQTFHLFRGRYPKSLRELADSAHTTLTLECHGRRFAYDPKTGQVSCRNPGHERY